jgi:hypothetical protein
MGAKAWRSRKESGTLGGERGPHDSSRVEHHLPNFLCGFLLQGRDGVGGIERDAHRGVAQALRDDLWCILCSAGVS